jgi:formate--tetrahydrofolate ligase
MVRLDPTQLQDWQIAQEAEKTMKPVSQMAAEWGINEKELLPYGHHLGKIDFKLVTERLKRKSIADNNVTRLPQHSRGGEKHTTNRWSGLGKQRKKVPRHSPAFRRPYL